MEEAPPPVQPAAANQPPRTKAKAIPDATLKEWKIIIITCTRFTIAQNGGVVDGQTNRILRENISHPRGRWVADRQRVARKAPAAGKRLAEMRRIVIMGAMDRSVHHATTSKTHSGREGAVPHRAHARRQTDVPGGRGSPPDPLIRLIHTIMAVVASVVLMSGVLFGAMKYLQRDWADKNRRARAYRKEVPATAHTSDSVGSVLKLPTGRFFIVPEGA